MSKKICELQAITYNNLSDICGSGKGKGYILLAIGSENVRKIIHNLLAKNNLLNYSTGNLQEAMSVLQDPALAQKKMKAKTKGCLSVIAEEGGDDFPGISFLQEIRADKDLENLLVIIISGDSAKGSIGHASEAGANGFITISGGIVPQTIESKLLKVINDRANPPKYVQLIKAGEASLDQKDTENALKLFQGALEAYEKMALVKIEGLVAEAIKPGKCMVTGDKRANAERAAIKAGECKEKGDYENAIERLEKVLSYLGESVKRKEFKSNKSASMARILMLIGRTYENKKEMEEAESYYRKAVEANPISLKACLEMVGITEKQGDKEGSLRYLRQVNQINPHNSTRQQRLGELSLEAGNAEEAQSAFDYVIKANPQSLSQVSHLCLKAENTSLASYFLKKAVAKSKREESGAATIQDIVDQYNELGRQLRQEKKYDQAVEEYNLALQVSFDDPRLLFNKGRAFFDWSKTDKSKEMEAKNHFLKAAEIFIRKGEPDKELEEGLNNFLQHFGSSLEQLR